MKIVSWKKYQAYLNRNGMHPAAGAMWNGFAPCVRSAGVVRTVSNRKRAGTRRNKHLPTGMRTRISTDIYPDPRKVVVSL